MYESTIRFLCKSSFAREIVLYQWGNKWIAQLRTQDTKNCTRELHTYWWFTCIYVAKIDVLNHVNKTNGQKFSYFTIFYGTIWNVKHGSILFWSLFLTLQLIETVIIKHYNDVIMVVMASRISRVFIVCSTACSRADERKHQDVTCFCDGNPPGGFPSQRVQ